MPAIACGAVLLTFVSITAFGIYLTNRGVNTPIHSPRDHRTPTALGVSLMSVGAVATTFAAIVIINLFNT
jgi:hypothetical protein